MVKLVKYVRTDKDPPDVWLKILETQIQNTLKFSTLLACASFNSETVMSDWIQKWPG